MRRESKHVYESGVRSQAIYSVGSGSVTLSGVKRNFAILIILRGNTLRSNTTKNLSGSRAEERFFTPPCFVQYDILATLVTRLKHYT